MKGAVRQPGAGAGTEGPKWSGWSEEGLQIPLRAATERTFAAPTIMSWPTRFMSAAMGSRQRLGSRTCRGVRGAGTAEVAEPVTSSIEVNPCTNAESRWELSFLFIVLPWRHRWTRQGGNPLGPTFLQRPRWQQLYRSFRHGTMPGLIAVGVVSMLLVHYEHSHFSAGSV